MKRATGFPLAQPIGGPRGTKVEALEIAFDVETPHFNEFEGTRNLKIQKRFYHHEARRLVNEMEQHAPGGFMIAFLGELLYRHSNIFRVPLETPLQPQPDPLEPGQDPEALPIAGVGCERHGTPLTRFDRGHLGVMVFCLSCLLDQRDRHYERLARLLEKPVEQRRVAEEDGIIEFYYRVFVMEDEVKDARSPGSLLDSKAMHAGAVIRKQLREHFKVSDDDPGVPFE